MAVRYKQYAICRPCLVLVPRSEFEVVEFITVLPI